MISFMSLMTIRLCLSILYSVDAAEVDSVVYVDSAAYVYDILLGEHLLARARLRENLLFWFKLTTEERHKGHSSRTDLAAVH
jgi:hypothetical protein